MSFCLFVSDVHLWRQLDDPHCNFLRFLQTEAKGAKALYILGDLFDVWYNDAHIGLPVWAPLRKAFQTLNEEGTSIYLMRGNHDPRLSQEFASYFKDTHVIEEDLCLLNIQKRRIMLAHGDILSATKWQDSLWFSLLRKSWFSFRLFAKPVFRRMRFTRRMGRSNYLHKTTKIHPDVIAKEIDAYTLDYFIHGHIHTPGIRPANYHPKALQVTLGAWITKEAAYARLEEGVVQLRLFKSSKAQQEKVFLAAKAQLDKARQTLLSA